MSQTELLTLLPILIIAATALIVLLAVAFKRNHLLAAVLSAVGLVAALLATFMHGAATPQSATDLLIIDGYAHFYMALIFVSTLAVVIFAYGYAKQQEGNPEELYIVLLLATLGSAVMVASNHFASFFLGLELLTVSLYVMIAYVRASNLSLEAGTKYLILAAASSAFLLFGMALIYAELGTMQFGEIADLLSMRSEAASLYLLVGLALMVVGVGFKLAVVPFHMWTPDVYQGAPSPVTAYLATVSKGAMFALLLRYFVEIGGYQYAAILTVFSVIAIASMFVGNLLALLQDNVKRILAYSSIAHLGYLLVAFVAGGRLAAEAVTFYLVAYFITTLGAFGIISLFANGIEERVSVDDYRGLFWSHPGLSAAFTAVLLSLAGIPLTSGFIGKYFVVAAGVSEAQWALVIILVINSAIGLFYYLRIVVSMFLQPVAAQQPDVRLPMGGSVVLFVLTLALIWLGVYPTPVLNLIRSAVMAIGS